MAKTQATGGGAATQDTKPSAEEKLRERCKKLQDDLKGLGEQVGSLQANLQERDALLAAFQVPEDRPLPADVQYVTLHLPVFTGKLTGNDGGRGHIDGDLRRPAAETMQRVLLGKQAIIDALMADAQVPRRQLARIDVVRAVFVQVNEALNGEHADGEESPA